MICVSLGNVGFQHCLEMVMKSECAEIRLDLMDLSDDELKLICSEPCSIVATCRPGKYTDDERIRLLSLAIHHGAQYVDVEYEADAKYQRLIEEQARNKGVKVIISYHNYDKTPSAGELEAIIKNARLMGADLVKIATTALSPADCARVMGLYANNQDLIAFCMGEIGVISRVAAPYLGAEFTFAAFDETLATAPGQLTVEEMEKMFKIVKRE